MRARRRFSFACLILCIVSTGVWSVTPAERGPFAVAEFRECLEDTSRGRELDALVLYPMAAGSAETPAQGFPLLVFNHGFLLRGDLYRSYGEQLASHGFVVVLPTYPMSFFNLDHSALALDVQYVIDHYIDLDADLDSVLHGVLDESMVGTCGHSLGGKLALLEAVGDARIKAIAALDPVDSGGPGAENPILYPSVAPELMSEIRAPLLFVGAELGSIAYLLTPCAPSAENYQRFYEAANPPAIEITQVGTGHGQYVDSGAEAMMAACAPGTAETEWVRASSAAYLTAFFLGHLTDSQEALDWLEERLAQDAANELIEMRLK